MNVLDLLDQLEAHGVRLSVRDGNRLVTRSPGGIPTELVPHLRHHRDVIVAALNGFRLGVPLAPCTHCGRVSAVALRDQAHRPRKVWPRCRMKPGCPGRHMPRHVDLERIDPVLLPNPEAEPPEFDVPEPTLMELANER